MDDRGSFTLELSILAPVLLAVVGLLVFAGRTAIAGQSVEAAAADAARQASIARTAQAAQADGTASARATLTRQGLQCVTTSVNIDIAGFNVPVGTPATIRATVSCVVNLADLAAPGVPGSRTVTATATSPLDTYRTRS